MVTAHAQGTCITALGHAGGYTVILGTIGSKGGACYLLPFALIFIMCHCNFYPLPMICSSTSQVQR